MLLKQNFGKYLYDLKWLNFGGGHHITREDYDIELLINCINHMKEKYDLEIYLEPYGSCGIKCRLFSQ